MSIYKIPLPLNILEAARERITWTLNTLPRVCVSFSGGKDSGLMLHLTAELARQMGKKICVLFIDWEAQFSCTINYVQSLRELYTDVIEEFYWVALPLTTQNSLSQYQPEWQCWEPDIWTWYANHQSLCNPLYNLMYQAGVPLRHMRICEPFGPEQRQGLWLYHVIEPDRWAAMCARVSGVKSGGIYAGHDNHFYGHRKILKPEHLDWQEYALLLLNSMPEKTAEHYRNKIAIYLHWYQKKGIEVPQTQQGDIGAKDIPSWRRICKVLLNNDYWCRALSFSPTKSKNYQRYNERIKGKRQEWGILCNND
ncbi:TPA: DUF3440 domain-containing protein [Escherichia coli]|nr:DUF3440 domain-containing protein [Escherichia coli]HCO0286540.1 DUF3440 domain-containing protein [Escherichia coli]